ncbi:MAG: LacI family DNA-binding transcriptional regulator [Actinomycetota bacterium]
MADIPQHVTIEDVARAAGVSVATVSRALRGLDNVAQSTREKVELVAAELDYRANPAAAQLATGSSRTILMAVANIAGWYCAQVVGGAEAVLSEAGYETRVMGVAGPDARKAFVQRALRMHRNVDGLILVDLRLDPDEVDALRETDLHVATIGNAYPGLSSVRPDDISAARLGVEHLLRLGHTRIALIEGMPDDPMKTQVSWRRRDGYEQALAHHQIAVDPDLVQAGYFSIDGAQEATQNLLALDDPPTAIFAISDEMAMGAMGVIGDAGLSVPGDISVVGIDDHPLAQTVGLTTVRQAPAANGAIAARWLVDDLASGTCNVSTREVEIDLVVRRTTGSPPGH